MDIVIHVCISGYVLIYLQQSSHIGPLNYLIGDFLVGWPGVDASKTGQEPRRRMSGCGPTCPSHRLSSHRLAVASSSSSSSSNSTTIV